eukprot:jgi/Chrzof1/6546/Cz19g00180.t1
MVIPCLGILAVAGRGAPMRGLAVADAESLVVHADESESDILPFALDSEGPSAAEPVRAGGTGATAMPRPTAGATAMPQTDSASAVAHKETDVAVGAFIRLMQDAPPLDRRGCTLNITPVAYGDVAVVISKGSSTPVENGTTVQGALVAVEQLAARVQPLLLHTGAR